MKGLRKYLDAQVRVNQVMIFVLFIHMIVISFTSEICKLIRVFVREIMMKILIVLQALTRGALVRSNSCWQKKYGSTTEMFLLSWELGLLMVFDLSY